jgi:hypothetical protein
MSNVHARWLYVGTLWLALLACSAPPCHVLMVVTDDLGMTPWVVTVIREA